MFLVSIREKRPLMAKKKFNSFDLVLTIFS